MVEMILIKGIGLSLDCAKVAQEAVALAGPTLHEGIPFAHDNGG